MSTFPPYIYIYIYWIGAMTKTGVSTEYHDAGDLVDRKRQDIGPQVDTSMYTHIITLGTTQLNS